MSRAAAVFVLALTVAASLAAQQADTPRPANDTGKPRPPAPQEQAASPRPAAEPQGQVVNIKFDVTITDQAGATESAKKTLTLLAADRQTGYIRTTGVNEKGQVRLNVDARPQILPNGSIRAMVSLEYPTISQQVTVILEPGKPQVVTQTADPLSDRKVTVEVRATVLK
jgi:glucose/arabinose dehydrogenase